MVVGNVLLVLDKPTATKGGSKGWFDTIVSLMQSSRKCL